MSKSPKHLEAEMALPVELRLIFEELVIAYQDASEKHTSDHSRRVNYNILADLVRDGWRRAVAPDASD